MTRWNDFRELIRSRRSIRSYQEREVAEEEIKKMLEAVRIAPSSSNSQPWHVVVVKDKDNIKELSRSAPAGSRFVITWMENAPVVFVLTVKQKLTHLVGRVFGHHNLYLDAGIAGQHLILAATALGLGTCWVGWFSEKKVRALLKIPSSHLVVGMIACGYPARKPQASPRKHLDEIYSLEYFHGKGS